MFNLVSILKTYNLELHRELKNYQYYLVLIDDMMPKEYDDMTEEDRIKSCSTKLFQKFNDINVPVVIMVTKNKKSINFIMEKYLSLL